MGVDLDKYLTSASSIKVSSVEFDYRFDSSIGLPVPSGSHTLIPYVPCPTKLSGSRKMTLDAASFLQSLGVPSQPLFLTFEAGPAFPPQNSQLATTWTIDQSLNIDLPDQGVSITGVKGSFTTLMNAISPPISDTGCDHVDNFYGVILRSEGGADDKLTLSGEYRPLSTGISVIVERFSLAAIAGVHAAFDLRMRIPGTPCDHPILVDAQVQAFADISGVPVGINPTFQWTATNAQIIGPANQSSLSFKIGSSIAEITVVATVGPQTKSVKHVLIPLPPSNLEWMQRICKLRTIAQVERFVNPLWDPLRDHVTRPITQREFERAAAWAKQLEDSAREARMAMTKAANAFGH